ncbi:MAG: hypothetical protein HXS54_07400 [Theionarchaea archaeon]|nr:hypothetical protein [Theionarchaea archaeon]
MQREISNLGGIFLLFLFICAILSCIQPDTATTENTTSYAEDMISGIEDIISTEDTITWVEDTLCTSVIDGDTFKLESGETVRLIGIDAPELSQPGDEESREYLTQLILNKGDYWHHQRV